MDKLFSNYLKELRGEETYYHKEVGFLTYVITGEEFYIREIYVEPAFRRQKVAWEMVGEISKIALEKGCTFLAGTVIKKQLNPTPSACSMLSYGFQIHNWDDEKIIFTKRIAEPKGNAA